MIGRLNCSSDNRWGLKLPDSFSLRYDVTPVFQATNPEPVRRSFVLNPFLTVDVVSLDPPPFGGLRWGKNEAGHRSPQSGTRSRRRGGPAARRAGERVPGQALQFGALLRGPRRDRRR